MTEAWWYSLFGLAIRSEIALPELASAPPASEADVEIRHGAVPAADQPNVGYIVTPEGTLLDVAQVGRFLIRDGREIVVEKVPEGSDRNRRLYLLGSVFGALLHQRGLLPLHANAIQVDGRAIAFSGHSGAGKSTIAAWFHDRGHPILADDVCVITPERGGALAWPGVPRLRLWREALEESGRSAEGLRRSFDDLDKWDVPADITASGPLPLARIYILARAPEGASAPSIRRLTGVEAVEALVSNTYRGGYVRIAGLTAAHLATCAAVARAVPVFEAQRLWGFGSFDSQAEMLRAHAAADAEGRDAGVA